VKHLPLRDADFLASLGIKADADIAPDLERDGRVNVFPTPLDTDKQSLMLSVTPDDMIGPTVWIGTRPSATSDKCNWSPHCLMTLHGDAMYRAALAFVKSHRRFTARERRNITRRQRRKAEKAVAQ